MSVNGIEIKVGQKWLTKGGEEVVIYFDDEEDTDPIHGSDGIWRNRDGVGNIDRESDNLDFLIQDVKQHTFVFQEGDVVYTTTKGKGVVVQVATTRSDRVKVKHDDGKEFWHNPLNVSFSPWQAPNHTRPVEDGYWIVKLVGDDYNIVCALGGELLYQGGLKIDEHYLKNIVYVKYLGKEIV